MTHNDIALISKCDSCGMHTIQAQGAFKCNICLLLKKKKRKVNAYKSCLKKIKKKKVNPFKLVSSISEKAE